MNMKFIKRATTAILAAVMCLSFSSCGDTSYIAKAEGETIPAGLYILSQYAALAEAQQTSGYDSSLKNIWDNKLENKSLKNWVNDRALELVKQYAEVELSLIHIFAGPVCRLDTANIDQHIFFQCFTNSLN